MIKRIEITNFRGIPDTLAIDMPKGESVLVWARNGDGKSSIADALEWLLAEHDRVEHLQFGRMRPRDYRHIGRQGADGVVRIEGTLEGQPFDEKRVISADGTFSPVPASLSDVFPSGWVLRFRDLDQFVTDQPNQRYERLADLLGLGALTQVQDDLDGALKDFGKTDFDSREQAQTRALSGLLDARVDDPEEAVCVWATAEVARVGGGTAVTGRQDLDEAVTELEGMLRDLYAGAGIAEIQQAEKGCEALREFGQKADDLLTEWSRRQSGFQDCIQDLADAKFLDLLAAAQRAFDHIPDGDAECPLCGQRGLDGAEFKERIRQRREALGDAQGAKKRLDGAKKAFRRFMDDAARKVDDLGGQLSALGLDDCAQQLSGMTKQLEELATRNRAPHNRTRTTAESLRRALARIRKQLKELRQRVDEDEKVRSIRALREDLAKAGGLLDQLDALASERNAHETLKSEFEHVVTTYHEWVERVVDGELAAVSEDLNRFYQVLHPDEGSQAIRLVRGKRQKQAGLALEFHGHKLSDPRQCLSTSHLNSLGLCAFLANAKRSRGAMPFVVLDDVVTSFDIEHRRRIIPLLEEEFCGFQILLLTHDEWVRDEVNRRLNTSMRNWRVCQLVRWTFEEGPRVQGRKPDSARIEALLRDEVVELAGNLIRQYAEWLYRELCRRWNVCLPFRMGRDNDNRVLGDIHPHLRKVLEGTVDKAGNPLILIRLLDELQSLFPTCNWLSHARSEGNYCTSLADAEDAWKAVSALASAVVCPKCGVWLKLTKSGAGFPCKCP